MNLQGRVSRPGKRRFGAVLALIGVILLAGCFSKSKKQTALFHEFIQVDGTVSWEPPVHGPVVVFFTAASSPASPLTHQEFGEPQEFSFLLPAGSYRFFAFADENNDLAWDTDEPGVAAEGIVSLTGPRGAKPVALVLRGDGAGPEAGRIDLSAAGEGFYKSRDNIGRVLGLDDPRFGKEYAKKGVWAPIDFLTEIGAGVYFLEPYDPKRIPVLFVHGAEGSPLDFQYLATHLDRERFQAWVVHYPSGMHLDFLGDRFSQAIEGLRARLAFPRLYVVAHSMGGLVSRHFIQTGLANGQDVVKKFVSISSPWEGHNAAATGVKMAGEAIPAWVDMVPGSPFLQALLATPLPDSIEYYLLFSYKGSSMFTAGADDGSVAVSSQLALAVQDNALQVRGFNESHTSILGNEDVLKKLHEVLGAE